MKSIPLNDYETSAKELIKTVLETHPGDQKQGISVGDMRNRMKILDALEKANGSVELEDAEHDLLKALYASYPFARVHPDILKIMDDIEEA